jgi:hypothetical protein
MWTKLFQQIMATEEKVLPIFLHDPQSQAIAGAVMVTETIFATIFGIALPAPAAIAGK